MTNSLRILVVGNPNCGKTVVFNALTGLNQKIGNWSGVTVEHKQGRFLHQGCEVVLTDLPGIYSMTMASGQGALDALVACQHLLNHSYDLIINILDAAHLERHLYLSSQLQYLGIPMLMVTNMMDVAERQGIRIDTQKLSKQWHCPVVPMVANKGKGVSALKDEIIRFSQKLSPAKFDIAYPWDVSEPHRIMTERLIENKYIDLRQRSAIAFGLCEGDRCALELSGLDAVEVEKCLAPYPDLDLQIAGARYQAVAECVDAVTQQSDALRMQHESFLDKIVLNKYLGVPIFFLVMYLMFYVAISIGGVFQDFFDILSDGFFVNGMAHLLNIWHAPAWLQAFLADGIGKGINTTVTFIPVIGGMFLCLSFLEDSGYMARAACVMDRFMRSIGLSGKAFVPMIVGFGCNVPAVMGARTLNNKRDRILSVMMMPFMTCGARLAIFSVFAAAFFPHQGSYVIFALYMLGIVVAIITAKILGGSMLKSEQAPLVMEMPAYHVPKLIILLKHSWRRLHSFVYRAGKNIIFVCVIIGGLNAISTHGKIIHQSRDVSQSMLSQIGRDITPIFHPMGITQDNWPATVGLVTGVLAKEVVVGSLNTLYSFNNVNLASQNFSAPGIWHDAVASIGDNASGLLVALKNPVAASEADNHMDNSAIMAMKHAFISPMAAFAYLVFVLLYFPCVSTMAAIRRELGLGWMCFSIAWTTGFAYLMAVMVYQLSRLWV